MANLCLLSQITMALKMTSILIFPMMLLASFNLTESQALPGCPGECGNLSIPFPFGIASDCYLDDFFLIICNSSFIPPKPFLQLGHAEVLNISLDGKIKILNSSSELMALEQRSRESAPIVIEWAAGNVACHIARNNASHYACQSQHSICTDSSIGRGHICHCLPGYEGNPYLLDGCQDIDECAVLKPCEHDCINFPGSFKCYCPEGLVGDGTKDGSGCHPKDQATWSASIYFPLGMLLLVPALASTWIVRVGKEKTLMKHRGYIFEKNGGKLLEKKLSKLKKPARNQIRVYRAEDMKKATDEYNMKMEYKCRSGTCYHGRLVDSTNTEKEVVVMKIPSVPKPQLEQFVDQLISLSQPHKNLVKILGCCLETEEPLIVYEFHGKVPTLFDHVHDEDLLSRISCKQRVEIAAGAARALTRLHSKNSYRSIVHGNVSSTNIFLDDSNDAKLFYDVASNLTPQEIPSSEQENYVLRPPELFTCHQVNKKTDVYGFGSILTELLPGWKITAPAMNGSDRNAQQPMKDKIAMLAERCLSVEPEKRPNMKEVEETLRNFLK